MPINKKAQLSDTMTWIVATIIIVLVLLTAIYSSSFVAKTKKFLSYDSYERSEDLILTKTTIAYFLASDDFKSIILFKLKNDFYYVPYIDKLNEIGDNLK